MDHRGGLDGTGQLVVGASKAAAGAAPAWRSSRWRSPARRGHWPVAGCRLRAVGPGEGGQDGLQVRAVATPGDAFGQLHRWSCRSPGTAGVQAVLVDDRLDPGQFGDLMDQEIGVLPVQCVATAAGRGLAVAGGAEFLGRTKARNALGWPSCPPRFRRGGRRGRLAFQADRVGGRGLGRVGGIELEPGLEIAVLFQRGDRILEGFQEAATRAAWASAGTVFQSGSGIGGCGLIYSCTTDHAKGSGCARLMLEHTRGHSYNIPVSPSLPSTGNRTRGCVRTAIPGGEPGLHARPAAGWRSPSGGTRTHPGRARRRMHTRLGCVMSDC